MGVRVQLPTGVLDRTPVLPSPAVDLAEVAREPVAVRAEAATQLFDDIELRQVLAIEGEVIAAPRLLDAMDGKAGAPARRLAVRLNLNHAANASQTLLIEVKARGIAAP